MVEGGAPHTANRSQGSIVVVSLGCPPAPIYIGARGEAADLWGRRTKGESYSRWELDTPLGRATLLGRPPPPLLYIRGQGAPQRHNN